MRQWTIVQTTPQEEGLGWRRKYSLVSGRQNDTVLIGDGRRGTKVALRLSRSTSFCIQVDAGNGDWNGDESLFRNFLQDPGDLPLPVIGMLLGAEQLRIEGRLVRS
jgi:hypothetical protein